MTDLLKLRNEIDEIDDKIVELFERRMKVSSEVADYKMKVGKPVFDKQREQEKIKKVWSGDEHQPDAPIWIDCQTGKADKGV